MAALPANNTNRLIVSYLWRGIPHTTLYRFSDTVSQLEACELVDTFHDEVKSSFYTNWRVGDASWSPRDSLYSAPAELESTGTAGTAGADTNANPDSLQFQFVARSYPGGRRVSYFFQGADLGVNSSMREPWVDASKALVIGTGLLHMADAGLVTISGGFPIFKTYVNYVVNDYLTRQARRG